MVAKKMNSITLENVRILFRNFIGAEGKYNRAGARNFCAVLPNDIADLMERDGWNVKTLKAREEGDEPLRYIKCSVNYNGRPPRIVMITSRGKTHLGEDMVSVLDWAEITNVDLIINPFEWDINGSTGVSAYVQSAYVTISEDELEKKYLDVPDSAAALLHADGHDAGDEPPW
jgi:hypothetical protein